MKNLLKKPADFEWYTNVKNVLQQMDSIKSNLARALQSLNITEEERGNPESFLDFGILISL